MVKLEQQPKGWRSKEAQEIANFCEQQVMRALRERDPAARDAYAALHRLIDAVEALPE